MANNQALWRIERTFQSCRTPANPTSNKSSEGSNGGLLQGENDLERQSNRIAVTDQIRIELANDQHIGQTEVRAVEIQSGAQEKAKVR